MVWRCDFCGEQYESREEAEKCEKKCLKKDKAKIGNNKKYRCDFCRKVYSTKKEAEKCENKCSKKQEVKKSKNEKVNYTKLNEKEGEATIQANFKGKVDKKSLEGNCPNCGEKFKFNVDLKKNTNIIEITCPKCKATITGTSKVNRTYICDSCKSEYSSEEEADNCKEVCSDGFNFLGNNFSNLFERNRFCFNNKEGKINEGYWEQGLVDKIEYNDEEIKKYFGIFGTKKEKIKQEVIDASNSFEDWLRIKARDLLHHFRNFMGKYGEDQDWINEHKPSLFNLVETKLDIDLTELEKNKIWWFFLEEDLIERYMQSIKSKMSEKEIAEIFVTLNGEVHSFDESFFDTVFTCLTKTIERIGIRDIDLNKLKKDIMIISKKKSASMFEENLNKKELFDWAEIESLNGLEFEKFLAKLFRNNGYKAEITKGSGDQGADLILEDNEGNKIAVQAKKWIGAVGNSAVQQVVASKKFYRCEDAWVISTNNNFTKSAIALAKKNNVQLIGKNELKEFF